MSKQEEFDEESFKDLLSLLKNVDIEPQRNELCYCMSGKKYKKCCMDKEKEFNIEFVESRGFDLAPDMARKVFQYDMSDEDYYIAADCYELLLVGEEDLEATELLDGLLEKYPKHPILHAAQALRYLVDGEMEVFENKVKQNLKKFPDSTINRLLEKYHECDVYASRFFSTIEKKLKEAPPEGLDFKNTYGKKEVPLTEFLLTLSLKIYKNLFNEKLHKAISLLEMMGDILEQMEWEDHFLLKRMKGLLILAKLTRRVKIFLANYSEEKSRDREIALMNG